MQLAEAHYRGQGWTVVDVSARESYDLHCTRADVVLRVEVKGTTGAADHIRLTGNEVSYALAHPTTVALFVVHSVALDHRDAEPVALGGHALVYEPWRLETARLTPVTWLYALDGAAARP